MYWCKWVMITEMDCQAISACRNNNTVSKYRPHTSQPYSASCLPLGSVRALQVQQRCVFKRWSWSVTLVLLKQQRTDNWTLKHYVIYIYTCQMNNDRKFGVLWRTWSAVHTFHHNEEIMLRTVHFVTKGGRGLCQTEAQCTFTSAAVTERRQGREDRRSSWPGGDDWGLLACQRGWSRSCFPCTGSLDPDTAPPGFLPRIWCLKVKTTRMCHTFEI